MIETLAESEECRLQQADTIRDLLTIVTILRNVRAQPSNFGWDLLWKRLDEFDSKDKP